MDYLFSQISGLLTMSENGMLELIASITSLYCVYLTVQRNIWCWPVGMIASVFCWITFHEAKLYADADLQIYFIAMSVYGWYHWQYGGVAIDDLPVTSTPRWMWAWILSGTTVVVLAIAVPRALYTDAKIPYIDTWPNVLSVVAQWMLSRKYIENWILWIVVDVILIVIYMWQDLRFLAFTYAIFLCLATKGLLDWRRTMVAQAKS
ncbi:MAG: nicotinamide riboside transporter PnuC [Candidatus Methylacidiphilales bacterium]|nr:nicotinamide riboside transporter PnuC [Candidatus Methylacidiphilales bacterium]